MAYAMEENGYGTRPVTPNVTNNVDSTELLIEKATSSLRTYIDAKHLEGKKKELLENAILKLSNWYYECMNLSQNPLGLPDDYYCRYQVLTSAVKDIQDSFVYENKNKYTNEYKKELLDYIQQLTNNANKYRKMSEEERNEQLRYGGKRNTKTRKNKRQLRKQYSHLKKTKKQESRRKQRK